MMKYSLIICSHNEEKFIGKTIRNILFYIKEREDVEIVIIDDNSSDKTNKIIQTFSSKKLKLISLKKNRGISFCRNLGVSNAEGKYLVFLDSHITLNHNIFKVYDSLLEKYNSIDGITGKYISTSKNDYNRIRDVVRSVYRKKDESDFIITHNNFTTISSCIFCVKKEIIKKNHFSIDFNKVAAEDTFLQLVLMDKGYKFLHSNKISINHDAELSFTGLLKKIIYQCRGTHRLLANYAKSGKSNIPYLTFYLDFPLLSFISFYALLVPSIIFGFKAYYLVIFLFSLLVDFHKLYLLVPNKRFKFKRKLGTAIYIFLNEGVKIFDWPISIFREKYSLKDFILVVKIILVWQVKKIMRSKK
jgi:glycosyltransferase involved in cell wall biosynthesis